MFFPSLFNNVEEKESLSLRKKRIIAMCNLMTSEDDEKDEAGKGLFNIELDILKLRKPKNFIGVESYEIKFEKNYQAMVCNLGSHTNKEVGKMKVIEVYTLLEMLQKNKKTDG